MGLRISILQQSAAKNTDSADRLREREGSSGGSGDEGQGKDGVRRDASAPVDVSTKWTAMFEARDRAGMGVVTVDDLQAVLEEVRRHINSSEET